MLFLVLHIYVTCNVPCNRCADQQKSFVFIKKFHYGQLTFDYGLWNLFMDALTFHYGLADLLWSKFQYGPIWHMCINLT